MSEEKKQGFFKKLFSGMSKTRDAIADKVDQLIKYYRDIDDDFYEELEDVLISSDVGATLSRELVANLKKRVRDEKVGDTARVKDMLRELLYEMMGESQPLELPPPTVILIVGVNGVGKTTSIGKLASVYKTSGKTVLLAAADTFRAAAAEQLSVWAKRADVPLIKHQEGADPAAVVFDAAASAKARGVDLLIVDTAGRLHNKKNLMDELAKINRVIDREYPNAHRENWLVLDATTGQNAVTQAKTFCQTANLTGLILTKLDGSAKGGAVLAMRRELDVPIRYIGVGEAIDDLQEFDAHGFVSAFI